MYLITQVVEPCSISFPACPNQYVARLSTFIQPRQDIPTADFSKAPLEAVSVHDVPPVLRDDNSHPGTRSGGRREEDIDQSSPLSLPPLQQPPDFIAVPYARALGQALSALRRPTVYLRPIVTTRRERPLLRRRLSALRPPVVFIRARNPCLLIRLRFRGLYVGIMASSPINRCSYVYKRA